MDSAGMKKGDLHHATGIPYHRLNPWFIRDNAKPNAEDIEAVAAALHVQASYLITGESEINRDQRSWILNVYDNLPPDRQAQLEGFVRFLADEVKGSPGTEKKPRVPRGKGGQGA